MAETSSGNLTLTVDVKNQQALQNLGKVRQNLDGVKSKAKEASKEAGELSRQMRGVGNELGSQLGIGGLGRNLTEISEGLKSGSKAMKLLAVANIGMMAFDIGKEFWGIWKEQQQKAIEEIRKNNEEANKATEANIKGSKGAKGIRQSTLVALSQLSGGTIENTSAVVNELLSGDKRLAKAKNFDKLRELTEAGLKLKGNGFYREGDIAAMARAKIIPTNLEQFSDSMAGIGDSLSKGKIKKIASESKKSNGITLDESLPKNVREGVRNQIDTWQMFQGIEAFREDQKNNKNKAGEQDRFEKSSILIAALKRYGPNGSKKDMVSDKTREYLNQLLLDPKKFDEATSKGLSDKLMDAVDSNAYYLTGDKTRQEKLDFRKEVGFVTPSVDAINSRRGVYNYDLTKSKIPATNFEYYKEASRLQTRTPEESMITQGPMMMERSLSEKSFERVKGFGGLSDLNEVLEKLYNSTSSLDNSTKNINKNQNSYKVDSK